MRPPVFRSVVATVVTLALGLLLAGCGGRDADVTANRTTSTDTAASADSADSAGSGAPLSGSIIVSAAASLTGVFTDLGATFEADHPGTSIEFAFDSSKTLATQIRSGAPADVFASADPADMDSLVDAGLVDGTPAVFARNTMAIVVKPGNPDRISALADLPSAGVISLCAETAPCGRYADQILGRAGVTLPEDRVTRGQNAATALAAVARGDADAGIVYLTDARATAGVDTVEIPAADNAEASYPIAVVNTTANRDLAAAFVDLVSGSAGRAALVAEGFIAP